MNRADIIAAIAKALTRSPDRAAGRRLAIVEQDPESWRIAYLVPRYRNAWRPGVQPDEWLIQGWLDDDPWPEWGDAAAVAAEIRSEILTLCPEGNLFLFLGLGHGSCQVPWPESDPPSESPGAARSTETD